jgi:hypothetical protein
MSVYCMVYLLAFSGISKILHIFYIVRGQKNTHHHQQQQHRRVVSFICIDVPFMYGMDGWMLLLLLMDAGEDRRE